MITINAEKQAQLLKDNIQAQIDWLESASKTFRFGREALLVQAVSEAAKLNVTEAQLYVANSGYKKLRDLDNQIKALRASMPK